MTKRFFILGTILLLAGVIMISCESKNSDTTAGLVIVRNKSEIRKFGQKFSKNVRDRNFKSLFESVSIDQIFRRLNAAHTLNYNEKQKLLSEFDGEFRFARYLTDFAAEDGTFHFMKEFRYKGKQYIRCRAYQNFTYDIIDLEMDLSSDTMRVIDGYSYLLDKSFTDYYREMLFDVCGRNKRGMPSGDRKVWAEKFMLDEVQVRNAMFDGQYELAKLALNKLPESERYRGYVRRTELGLIPYLPEYEQQRLLKKFENQATNDITKTLYKAMYVHASSNPSELFEANKALEELLKDDIVTWSLTALADYKKGDFNEALIKCDSVLTFYDGFSELRLLRLLSAQNLDVAIGDTLNGRIIDSYDLNDMTQHDEFIALNLSNRFK